MGCPIGGLGPRILRPAAFPARLPMYSRRSPAWTYAVLALTALGAAPPKSADYEQKVKPLITARCLECHSGAKPKGDFNLERLPTDFAKDANQKQWLKALERVKAGEMPPQPKAQLTEN